MKVGFVGGDVGDPHALKHVVQKFGTHHAATLVKLNLDITSKPGSIAVGESFAVTKGLSDSESFRDQVVYFGFACIVVSTECN